MRYSVAFKIDLVNEKALISVHDHELTVNGVQDMLGERIYANSFLDLQFRVRSGTGGKLRRSVLFCVSQGRVYKAMDFYSESVWRLSETYNKAADSLKLFDEKSDYHATLSISQVQVKAVKALLFESDKVESKYDPSKNVASEKSYELVFDPALRIFYNSTKRLNKLYKIYSGKENQMVQRFINAEVPCIQLSERLYLYIDNEWFFDNGNDSLSCL